MAKQTSVSNILNSLRRGGLISKHIEDTAIDLFISGYGFTIFELPPALRNFSQYITKDIPWYKDEEILFSDNGNKIKKILEAHCFSINGIPDYRMNRENVIAGFSTVGTTEINIQNDVAFTLSFMETQGTLISKFFQSWLSVIRHPIYGISRLEKDKYDPANYSGNIIHATLQPNLLDIENIVYLSGVRPDSTVNNTSLSTTIITSDSVDLQVSMVCDVAYINQEDIYNSFINYFEKNFEIFLQQVETIIEKR